MNLWPSLLEFATLFQTLGNQTFHGKGPHHLLWAGLPVSRGKITVSGMPRLWYSFYTVSIIYKCCREPHIIIGGLRVGDLCSGV